MILPISYFPSVEYLYHLKYSGAVIEVHENFVRQSERNRCELLSDKGVQRLTVPIAWRHGQKMPLAEVQIDYSQSWQRTHLKTIRTCYASAGYFDHFFPEIEALLSQRPKFLLDYDVTITQELLKLFKISAELKFTDTFIGVDKRQAIEPYEYYQVFSDKLPFESGLSSLDMLFCEGAFIL